MSQKFTYARALAKVLVAFGFVACLATDTFAANRTWTSSAIGTNSYNKKWGTAFSSNWAGNTVPTTADVAVFGTNAGNQYTLQVQPGVSVAGIRFNSTGTNSYIFGTNGMSIGASGVVNNSGRQQTFGQAVTLTANQTWSGGVSGSQLVFNNIEVNGKNLTTSTDVTLNTLGNTGGAMTYTVAGGNSLVVGGGPTADVNFVVTSGFLTTADVDQGAGYDASLSTLDVSGTGTYNNSKFGGSGAPTNWASVTMSSGAIDLMNTDGVLVSSNYTQTNGQIDQYVGWTAGNGLINSAVQSTNGSGDPVGPITLGGAMVIDFSPAGDHIFNAYDTWNLFQGVNTVAGAGATNFSSVVLNNVDVNSPYAGLSFTQYGSEWYTAPGTDGTWLVFQAQTGNLVVVPEPSTIVFAGLGVAMSGWTMWKKRRLSKLMANKAG